MNLPNLLTLLRFAIIPFFGLYLFKENYAVATALFLLGGLTDILDGYIARKYNLVTAWGKLADPAADKLMQITALVLLTLQHKIPIIVLIIIMAKEALMGVGSLFLYKKDNVVVSANWYGKMATVVFYFAVIMIIFNAPYSLISNIFIALALCSTLFAFVMYVYSYSRMRKSYQKDHLH